MFLGKIIICLWLISSSTSQNAVEEDVEVTDDDLDEEEYFDEGEDAFVLKESNMQEATEQFWRKQSKDAIKNKLQVKLNKKPAKNIILFMGDGMSVATITAARIFKGQTEGYLGEEQKLSFEKFPFSGFSKTYCVDKQVTDSAASGTAYLTGVKTNYNLVGVSAAVKLGDCEAAADEKNQVPSLAKWAQDAGMRTGLITTVRVTHASPSPLYAHSAHRIWECDTLVRKSGKDPEKCPDIAKQMMCGEVGQNMNVIFGGGRGMFLPNDTKDESGQSGSRSDGINYIERWTNWKETNGLSHAYVYDRNTLLNVGRKDYVLGLFANQHMSYESNRRADVEPSLKEMTKAAIELLSCENKGFFLFVEGGKIDLAHHKQRAMTALEETVAFAEAVETAVNMTDESETLIVVTADHAHTMTISGYPERGNNIVDFAGKGSDRLPYLTLSYANGQFTGRHSNGTRIDLMKINKGSFAQYPGNVPKSGETHGGEDVAIYARGPWAHLLTGVNEQTVIPHVLAYAACIGESPTACT